MSKVYFLCGIGRSGTHALGSWLLPQIKPFLQMDSMNKEYSFSYSYYEEIKEQVAAGQLQMQSYEWDTVDQLDGTNYEGNGHWRAFTNQHNVLIHVESMELKHTGEEIEEYRKAGVDFKTILLLRNPFNNFASLWHSDPSQVTIKGDLWKQIAREFLDYTNYLGDKVFCIYDLWFTSEEYRKKMSKELDVEWDDTGLNTITRHGGSHFEGEKAGQDLNVLERWKIYYGSSDEIGGWYHLEEQSSVRGESSLIEEDSRKIITIRVDEDENNRFKQNFDEEVVELWKEIVERHKKYDIKDCLRNGLEIVS